MRYPWYETVDGSELQQGDLLPRCPIVVPSPDLGFPLREGDVTADIVTFDVVVMSQSCDLANDKVRDVIVCPHWDLEDAASMDASFQRKSAAEEVRKGRRPRYLLLAASDLIDPPLGVRLVDFGRIFSLPKPFLAQLAAHAGKRLRLCPPYREYLAQAFARFFMRVGLPQDVQLPR